MSILMFVISNGFSVLSIVYMPSGLGAVVGAISPIWVVLFSFLLFKKVKFKPLTIIGIVLGFLGVLVAFFEFVEHILYTNFSLGILYGVISSMTWALATLLTVKQSKDMDPYFSLGWQMFMSGIILNTISYVSGNFIPYTQVPSEAWLSIGYLILVGSVIAFAIVTESIFAWPGMGKLVIDSIFQLDRPVVVAYLMITVLMFVFINLVIDILYSILDPRVRLTAAKN